MCVGRYHTIYVYMLSLHRNFDVLKMLSESLILSRIDYALPVWGPPLNKSQVAYLQRLQNRAIRVTKCLRKYDHVSLHCLQLNWLPISHQITFKSCCAMYRYYHNGHRPCVIFDPPIWDPSQLYHTLQGQFCQPVDLPSINH